MGGFDYRPLRQASHFENISDNVGRRDTDIGGVFSDVFSDAEF